MDALTLTVLGCSSAGKARAGRIGSGRSLEKGYSSGLVYLLESSCDLGLICTLYISELLLNVKRTKSGQVLQRGTETRQTMERLGFLQKPFQPTPGEANLLELLERPALVDAGIVSELGAFDKGKDDCVF